MVTRIDWTLIHTIGILGHSFFIRLFSLQQQTCVLITSHGLYGSDYTHHLCHRTCTIILAVLLWNISSFIRTTLFISFGGMQTDVSAIRVLIA